MRIKGIKKEIINRGYIGYEELLLFSLEKVLSDRKLCPECLQILESDGSCLTCRFKDALEKEEQAHVMSVYDLNMKIAEIGIALEREKERADKLQGELKVSSPYVQEILKSLQQAEERADRAETHYITTLEDWNTERDYDRECLRKAEIQVTYEQERNRGNVLQADEQIKRGEERVKELEANIDDPEWCCTQHKADLVARLQKLVEAVEKHRYGRELIMGLGSGIYDEELYKTLEEVKSDLKDYTSPNLLVEQLSERIKELEELVRIQNDTITNSEKRINEAEYLRDGMQTRCGELFLENESLQETIKFWKKSYNEDIAHSKQSEERVKNISEAMKELTEEYLKSQSNLKKLEAELTIKILENAKGAQILSELEERIKELEAQLASIKADPSIGKLEIVDSFDDNDWP